MKTVPYRTYCNALDKLRHRATTDLRIGIYDMGNTFDSDPVRLGVNWAAIGTVPASEAVDFAKALMLAAEAAENFEYNGCLVTYGEDC